MPNRDELRNQIEMLMEQRRELDERRADARQRLVDARRALADAQSETVEARRALADAQSETRALRLSVESSIAEAIDEARNAGVTWAALSAWMGSSTTVYSQVYRTRLAQRVDNAPPDDTNA